MYSSLRATIICKYKTLNITKYVTVYVKCSNNNIYGSIDPEITYLNIFADSFRWGLVHLGVLWILINSKKAVQDSSHSLYDKHPLVFVFSETVLRGASWWLKRFFIQMPLWLMQQNITNKTPHNPKDLPKNRPRYYAPMIQQKI